MITAPRYVYVLAHPGDSDKVRIMRNLLHCLLLLSLYLAIPLAPVDASEEDEKAAIAAIEKLGGTYGSDERLGDNVISLHGRGLTGNEPELALLRRLPAKAIDLGHNPKMRRFDDIWAIKTLQFVSVGGGGGLNNEGFQGIQNLTNLKSLDVHHSRVDANGYQVLKQLPHLTDAFIDGWSDDEVEQMLPVLSNLTNLRVAKSKSGKNMSGDGILKLSPLKRLRTLSFVNFPLPEDKVKELQGLLKDTIVKGGYAVPQ